MKSSELEEILQKIENGSITSIDLKYMFKERYNDGLKEIAEKLKRNSTIKHIIISTIGNEGAKVFAEVLKVNSTIESLNLKLNNIGSNGMTALAEGLKVNSSIRYLNLSMNYLGDAGAEALGAALEVNSTITILYLQSNEIGGRGAKALAKAFENNSTIRSINLSSNKMRELTDSEWDSGTIPLANALQTNSSITYMNLENTEIRDEGAMALSNALTVNKSLTSLNIASNHIGLEGVKALAESLKNNTTLTSLDISQNMKNIYPITFGLEGVQALTDSLKENTTLTSLNMSFNNIGPEGAEGLAEALKNNSSIKSLNISGNEIGLDGAKSLRHAFTVNKTITSLDISKNKIGMKELAEAFKINSTIKFLDLSGNEIGFDGIKELAEAFKINSTISYLNLSKNDIKQNELELLLEGLKDNSSLKSLNLYDNDIGPEGAKVLAKWLEQNSTIISLNVGRNKIRHDGASSFVDALKVNSTLQSLNILKNKTTQESLIEFAEVLKLNSTIISLDIDTPMYEEYWFETVQNLIKDNKVICELSNIFLKNLEIEKLSDGLKIAIKNNYPFSHRDLIEDSIERNITSTFIQQNNKIVDQDKELFQQAEKKQLISPIHSSLMSDPVTHPTSKVTYDRKQLKIVEGINNQSFVQNNQKKKEIISFVMEKVVPIKNKVLNKIYQSFYEFLELESVDRTKPILIPKKILLEFVKHGDILFTFKSRKFKFEYGEELSIKARVIQKLERIVKSQYISVIEELKERTEKQKLDQNKKQEKQKMEVQKTSTSSSRKQYIQTDHRKKDLPYQNYEKILFDTYKDVILKRFVEINEKKMEITEKKVKYLQKQLQRLQKQQEIQKLHEIQNLQPIQKLQVILNSRNFEIYKKKPILDTDRNKISENNDKLKLIHEIKNINIKNIKDKNLLKPTEMKKLEENILFYMLPETVIYKYFDPRNLGKAKDRKRKSKQDQLFRLQQETLTSGSAKKIKLDTKPDYLTYEIRGSESNGDITLEVVDENGKSKLEYLKASEKNQRIRELEKKGYTKV